MRVILDTNILLSALISPQGTPAILLRIWSKRRFVLISHAFQIDEFREVSRRDRVRLRIEKGNTGQLINRIWKFATFVDRLPYVQRSPDPRDDFLLALCEAASADWLVTGDKDDLLALKCHGSTQIVTARTMLDFLDASAATRAQ
jgi:uncharacterized protein